MINFDDLTLFVNSYETPKILYSCLQSFVFHHHHSLSNKFKLLVMENSRNSETEELLKKNNISFQRNPGLTHSPSIELGFQNIKTKYVLLFDSDILFLKPIDDLFELFKKNDLTVLGEYQESRGGYDLFPRISPVYCLIDLDKIKFHNIKWHDQKRIDETSSNGFFGNVPLQQNKGGKYYDNGSTFLEDIQKNKLLKVGKINQRIVDYRYEFSGGGASWKRQSGIKQYQDWLEDSERKFFDLAKKFENVDIKGRFENVV